jgi:AcrR family transcriptional regulator
VACVSERGTTAVPVTDLADAANVSRQLVYLQFGDRDSLLVAAAVDLAMFLAGGASGA